MKISVLKSIMREKGVEVLELKKVDIPFTDIIKHGMYDIEAIMEQSTNNFLFDTPFYYSKKDIGFSEFKLNIDGKIKNIKGIIYADSKEDVIEFLSKYYVEGDSVLDSCIKIASTKKEGIQKAFLTYFEDIEIVTFEFKELLFEMPHSLAIIKYKDFYVYAINHEFEAVIAREKFIRFKNYKIPRLEYLIFFLNRKNGPLRIRRYGMTFDRKYSKRKLPSVEVEKCLYYDGKEMNFVESLSSKIISKFETEGYMTFVKPEIFGYNFLKFRAFVPFKKEVKKKISKKRIKNPFGVPVLFAFDSKIPFNLPSKIRVIDDEEIIYAFNYIKDKKRGLPDFPLVYFHPSVKEDTQFLLIASV